MSTEHNVPVSISMLSSGERESIHRLVLSLPTKHNLLVLHVFCNIIAERRENGGLFFVAYLHEAFETSQQDSMDSGN